LSTLVVKLNLEWFQRLRRPSDIKLWMADHAQMDVEKVQIQGTPRPLQGTAYAASRHREVRRERKGSRYESMMLRRTAVKELQ
jgi:hypothetical protein